MIKLTVDLGEGSPFTICIATRSDGDFRLHIDGGILSCGADDMVFDDLRSALSFATGEIQCAVSEL